jgi:hypothetical protein
MWETPRLADIGTGASLCGMRVRISDPARLRDLIQYLREAGCVAEQASQDEIDVFVPHARSDRQARTDVGIYLAAWRVKNEGVRADLID